MAEGRDKEGRMLPGFTANPNGRPKRKTFRDYFNEEEEEALINRIKQELKSGEAKGDVTKMVVEHIFGKPRQPLVGGDDEDEPIKITGINYILPKDGNNSTPNKETTRSLGEAE